VAIAALFRDAFVEKSDDISGTAGIDRYVSAKLCDASGFRSRRGVPV